MQLPPLGRGRPQKKLRLALPPHPWTPTPQAPGPFCTFQGARRPNLPGVGVFERRYASPWNARGGQAASLRWHWVREARKEGIRSEKNAQVQLPPRKAPGVVPPAAPPPPSPREDSALHGRHSGWRADQRFLQTEDPRRAGAAPEDAVTPGSHGAFCPGTQHYRDVETAASTVRGL